MDNLKYLKEVLNEISELLSLLYSMGLMSVNNNTMEEIKKCRMLCNDCGFIFAKTSLDTLIKGLSESRGKLEKNYDRETEELLLLGNWLSLCKKELEIEEVRNNFLIRRDL